MSAKPLVRIQPFAIKEIIMDFWQVVLLWIGLIVAIFAISIGIEKTAEQRRIKW